MKEIFLFLIANNLEDSMSPVCFFKKQKKTV